MILYNATVENVGHIQHAELEVRPLTVFFGPNNTNKSWTAYGLYGLARYMSSARWSRTRSRSLREQ